MNVKNKCKFVMSTIIAITYLVAFVLILAIYAKANMLSEVYLVLSPMVISAIFCITMNK